MSITESPKHHPIYKLPKDGSLPKISQILHGPEKKKRKGKDSHGLMIEGKSKIIEDARSQEKGSKNIDKEIRDELKRIYKVRQVGHSYDPRIGKKKSAHSILLPPIRL